MSHRAISRRANSVDARDEGGIVLLAALLAMLLLMALGAALALAARLETAIAGSFLRAQEARAAADAALGGALVDLAAGDWNAILAGAERSSFTDGAPAGVRALPDGASLDLERLVALANCARPTPCSPAQLTAVTADRPWGPNNPLWRLYAYGSFDGLAGAPGAPPYYLVVLVADDPAETDDDPQVDGGGAVNPGAGVILVRAEAFGARGVRRAVAATIARDIATGLRIVSVRTRQGLF
jgi:hypothetical protein